MSSDKNNFTVQTSFHFSKIDKKEQLGQDFPNIIWNDLRSQSINDQYKLIRY